MTLKHSLLLLSLTGTLHATPIHIEANFASVNAGTHQHRFQEKVHIDETHQHLRAAWLEVTTDAHHQLTSAVARGDRHTRVHLWSTEKSPTLHAYADEVQYFPQIHQVIFIGHAHLSQGKNSFSAPKIVYDTLTQHVESEGLGHGRTTIILEQNHDTFIR
jgi:lipopolysaccharide export system protein LptA